MRKVDFKRIITFVVIFVMLVTMFPEVAIAESSGCHTVQNNGLTYNLPSLPTTNTNYILLKNTISKDVILLVGIDDGYFGSDTSKILNYNLAYKSTIFNSYRSTFNGTMYSSWFDTTEISSFNLSGYEIFYKSKDIYPIKDGHIFTTLPEGVMWEDKIIISYSDGSYRLYKPANNQGIWVDINNKNCDFVYRETLTSENQTLTRYVYNPSTRTWKGETSGRTEGGPGEIFFISSDVFLTNGTVKRVGQRNFYAQSSKSNNIQFEPLDPSEAKEFLKFIANVPDSAFLINIEQKLPEYYELLTGTLKDPREELKVKLSFLTYLYYCLDIQLAQSNKKIDMGTTYLINWVRENSQVSTVILDEIQDNIQDNLQNTIAENVDIPGMPTSHDIITGILEYGELLIHSVGSILAVQRVDDINYLRAYLKLLEAEYENDQYYIIYWELICDSIITNMTFGGNPQEMREYAKYIFDIEHSISNKPLVD